MSNAVKINNYQRQVNLLEISQRGQAKPAAQKADGGSFKEMFSEQIASDNGVNFSKHASQRLFSRNIELTDEQIGQISDAIDKAQHKGSKETLILTDDAALVVSVKDRMVVTAFDRDNLRDGIVTAIDSAVIL